MEFEGWKNIIYSEIFKSDTRSDHVGFVVDGAAMEQVYSEYFGFPYHFSFHQPLHIH
jgi:hypothetical protein